LALGYNLILVADKVNL